MIVRCDGGSLGASLTGASGGRRPFPVLRDRHRGPPGHRQSGLRRVRGRVADVRIPRRGAHRQRQQFTGRFTRPRPAEVMFERICRENGIVARNTKPRSPTTTGKVERFHQTLQRELLDHVQVWPDLQTAQAAIDTLRHEYNTDRPHQSLNMAFPADRFLPRAGDEAMSPRLPASTPPDARPSSPQGLRWGCRQR
jgi:integrase-like protein